VMIGRIGDALLLMPLSDPAGPTRIAMSTDGDVAVRQLIRRAAVAGESGRGLRRHRPLDHDGGPVADLDESGHDGSAVGVTDPGGALGAPRWARQPVPGGTGRRCRSAAPSPRTPTSSSVSAVTKSGWLQIVSARRRKRSRSGMSRRRCIEGKDDLESACQGYSVESVNPSAFPAVSTAKSPAVTTRRTWWRLEDIAPDAGI
jgi:hypothetical protein